jgi:hypothetical protein
VIGIGVGLITSASLNTLDWETSAAVLGSVVGLIVGVACLWRPIDQSAGRSVLFLAFVAFPLVGALVAFFYDSVPVIEDIELGWQWGYVAVFAIPAAATTVVGSFRQVAPWTTVRLALTASALLVPWGFAAWIVLVSIDPDTWAIG